MVTVIIATSLLLFIVYAALIIYYRRGWVAMPVFTPDEHLSSKTKISVVIPARNEEENITDCLDSVCRQSYPTNLFEVIVVDDHSTDGTAAVVKSFLAPNVKLLSLQDFTGGDSLNSYKKKAIEIAIQHAAGELIVTTDADCIVPFQWLQTIAQFYEQHNAALIAAPVYINCGFNFLQIFQSLDFMTLQGITGASVYKKLHSMCNGANLAYEKKVFVEVGGFSGIDSIASGDDMLLMHKIAKNYPDRVLFLKSTQAIVHTQPVNSLKAFFNQRIRWASKADKYQDKTILPVLIIVYFFNLLLLVMPMMQLFVVERTAILRVQFSLVGWWLLILSLKTIIELCFLYPVAGLFSKQYLLWWFPIMQPFHVIYTVIAGWLGKFGTYQWKDRKVK
ncbi:MAG: glycosyltransferase [Ferruginibacter sp.]